MRRALVGGIIAPQLLVRGEGQRPDDPRSGLLETRMRLISTRPRSEGLIHLCSRETLQSGNAMGVFSKQLFEEGEEAYGQAALDLVEAAGAGQVPPVPQLAKDVSLRLVTRVADQKMLSRYGDSLAEAFGVSYRFTVEESWEDLDKGEAERLMNAGLGAVRQQHLDTNVPDPLDPTDTLSRVHFTTLGLVGEHPAFTDLRAYMFSRAAYQRLDTLDDLHLQIGLHAGDVKGRHAEDFMRAQVLSWRIGRALGMLAVLGEVPE